MIYHSQFNEMFENLKLVHCAAMIRILGLCLGEMRFEIAKTFFTATTTATTLTTTTNFGLLLPIFFEDDPHTLVFIFVNPYV